jgi:hypothetical protein
VELKIVRAFSAALLPTLCVLSNSAVARVVMAFGFCNGKTGEAGSLATLFLDEEADHHDQEQCTGNESDNGSELHRVPPFFKSRSYVAAL